MATATGVLSLKASMYQSFCFTSKPHNSFHVRAANIQGSEIEEGNEEVVRKKIFVAGATGSTGKRIVEQLLAKGFAVKAGVLDVDKAKSTLPTPNPLLQIVKADVTEGSPGLANAIGNDADAVICATGFQRSLDFLAPWKVWAMFLTKYSINWAIPMSFRDALEHWGAICPNKSLKKTWGVIPLCIVWTIWKERNLRCFEGKRNQLQSVKYNCLHYMYFWKNGNVVVDSCNLLDLLEYVGL